MSSAEAPSDQFALVQEQENTTIRKNFWQSRYVKIAIICLTAAAIAALFFFVPIAWIAVAATAVALLLSTIGFHLFLSKLILTLLIIPAVTALIALLVTKSGNYQNRPANQPLPRHGSMLLLEKTPAEKFSNLKDRCASLKTEIKNEKLTVLELAALANELKTLEKDLETLETDLKTVKKDTIKSDEFFVRGDIRISTMRKDIKRLFIPVCQRWLASLTIEARKKNPTVSGLAALANGLKTLKKDIIESNEFLAGGDIRKLTMQNDIKRLSTQVRQMWLANVNDTFEELKGKNLSLMKLAELRKKLKELWCSLKEFVENSGSLVDKENQIFKLYAEVEEKFLKNAAKELEAENLSLMELTELWKTLNELWDTLSMVDQNDQDKEHSIKMKNISILCKRVEEKFLKDAEKRVTTIQKNAEGQKSLTDLNRSCKELQELQNNINSSRESNKEIGYTYKSAKILQQVVELLPKVHEKFLQDAKTVVEEATQGKLPTQETTNLQNFYEKLEKEMTPFSPLKVNDYTALQTQIIDLVNKDHSSSERSLV